MKTIPFNEYIPAVISLVRMSVPVGHQGTALLVCVMQRSYIRPLNLIVSIQDRNFKIEVLSHLGIMI